MALVELVCRDRCSIMGGTYAYGMSPRPTGQLEVPASTGCTPLVLSGTTSRRGVVGSSNSRPRGSRTNQPSLTADWSPAIRASFRHACSLAGYTTLVTSRETAL